MPWPGVIAAYRPYLDVANVEPVTLLEGNTPLIPTPRLAHALGLPYCDLRIKYEGLNPTGSFKARGLAVAVSKALELKVKGLAIPTALGLIDLVARETTMSIFVLNIATGVGAGSFGEIEEHVVRIVLGEYLAQIVGGIPISQGELVRPSDMGLSPAQVAGRINRSIESLIACSSLGRQRAAEV